MTAEESGEIIFYFGIATVILSIIYLYGSWIAPIQTNTDFGNVVGAPFIGVFGVVAAILGKRYAKKMKGGK
jgi:hypothetical protein